MTLQYSSIRNERLFYNDTVVLDIMPTENDGSSKKCVVTPYPILYDYSAEKMFFIRYQPKSDYQYTMVAKPEEYKSIAEKLLENYTEKIVNDTKIIAFNDVNLISVKRLTNNRYFLTYLTEDETYSTAEVIVYDPNTNKVELKLPDGSTKKVFWYFTRDIERLNIRLAHDSSTKSLIENV